MFYLLPVKKWWTHNTSCPRERRLSQRCEPRKPAPPVTTTFFRIAFCTEASLSLPQRVSSVSAARHPEEGRLRYETSSTGRQVRLPGNEPRLLASILEVAHKLRARVGACHDVLRESNQPFHRSSK